jgi:hypothetical protein
MVVLFSLLFLSAGRQELAKVRLRMVVLLRSVIPFLSRSSRVYSPEQTLGFVRVDWQQVIFGACDYHKSITRVGTLRMRYFLFHSVCYKPSKTLFLYEFTHKLSQERCFSQCQFYRSMRLLKRFRFPYVSSPHDQYSASYQQNNQPRNIQNALFVQAHTQTYIRTLFQRRRLSQLDLASQYGSNALLFISFRPLQGESD